MFTIVSIKTEIEKLHLQISKQLEQHITERMKVYVGYKGENLLLDVNYSEVLNIWWTFQKISDKYWNSYGVGMPSKKGNNSITCEINYPLDGIYTQLAGGLAKNEDGEVILIHSGRIGGGRKGIGKTLFKDNYIGEIVEISIKNRIHEYVPVGSLNSIRFANQVALFVKEIARIKELIKTKPPAVPTDTAEKKIKTTFNDEFWGKKSITKIHSGVAICDHGLIVNSFKEFLQQKGLPVANDRQRDLYVIKKGEIDTVYEFKTDINRQSVYSAIGQLMLNNVLLKPKPNYVLSLPIGLSDDIKEIIRSLDIELLEYKWVNSNEVKFLNLVK
jgi:hypothetical protein